jgi:hypothetical protein
VLDFFKAGCRCAGFDHVAHGRGSLEFGASSAIPRGTI